MPRGSPSIGKNVPENRNIGVTTNIAVSPDGSSAARAERRALLLDPTRPFWKTRAPDTFVADMETTYGGTRLGRQELDGELIVTAVTKLADAIAAHVKQASERREIARLVKARSDVEARQVDFARRELLEGVQAPHEGEVEG